MKVDVRDVASTFCFLVKSVVFARFLPIVANNRRGM